MNKYGKRAALNINKNPNNGGFFVTASNEIIPMIVTIAKDPAKPSIPSHILNALTRPTTAKIVKGIANLPNTISFEPNALPKDVIQVSVTNTNITQEII